MQNPRTHISQFKEGEIVPVFHFGQPDKMKVIGHDYDKGLVKLQYMELACGTDAKPVRTLNEMAVKCDNYKAPGTFK